MHSDILLQRMQKLVPDADIQLQGEGCSFSATVISPSFVGRKTLARQMDIMTEFNDLLLSGELHALTLHTFTPEEWQSKQALVTIS
jgi:acid stress-induced BolA-like protein IbaG/YrbA